MTSLIALRQRHGMKLLLTLALSLPLLVQAAELLPSWNDGPSKMSIIAFVQAVTTEGSRDYVKPRRRSRPPKLPAHGARLIAAIYQCANGER